MLCGGIIQITTRALLLRVDAPLQVTLACPFAYSTHIHASRMSKINTQNTRKHTSFEKKNGYSLATIHYTYRHIIRTMHANSTKFLTRIDSRRGQCTHKHTLAHKTVFQSRLCPFNFDKFGGARVYRAVIVGVSS